MSAPNPPLRRPHSLSCILHAVPGPVACEDWRRADSRRTGDPPALGGAPRSGAGSETAAVPPLIPAPVSWYRTRAKPSAHAAPAGGRILLQGMDVPYAALGLQRDALPQLTPNRAEGYAYVAPTIPFNPSRLLTRLHQLRGLGDAKVLKSLGHSPKGRHYRG